MNENTRMSNEAELEARIVAWVAGEASPVEIAELQKLVATNPELAIFKRRIEAVHGLLGEAARPEKEPLRLSAERRGKLLAAMGAPADANTDTRTIEPTVLAAKVAQRNRRWIYTVGTVAAACAIFALSIATLTQRTEFKVARMDAPARHAVPAAPIAVQMPTLESDQIAQARTSGVAETAMLQSAPPMQIDFPVPPAFQDKKKAVAINEPIPTFKPDTPDLRFSATLSGGRIASGPTPNSQPSQGGGGSASGGRGEGERRYGITAASRKAAERFYAPPNGNNDTIGGGAGELSLAKSLQPQGLTLSSPGTDGRVTQSATNEVIRLDPFNVSADADVGFVASSSLAGGRIATPLKDLNVVPLTAPGQSNLAEQAVQLDAFSVSSSPPRGFGSSSGLVGNRIVPTDSENQSAYSVTTKEMLPARSKGFFGGLFGRDNADDKKAEPPVQPAPVEAAPAPPARAEATTVGGAAAGKVTKTLASAVEVARLERELDRLRAAEKSADASARGTGQMAIALKDTPPGMKAGGDQDVARPVEPRVAQLEAEKAGRQSLETATAEEAISTFSLHVSDVSFRLAQAALARGEMPDASRIRPEEFYNAFDYGDPAPSLGEKVGAKIEQSAHPVLQQRNLVRIAMKVPSTGRGSGTPLRLTVLLDTSGSMEREDRAASVRRAFEVLVSLLGPNDRITLVGFARQPRLLAENLAGNEARSLLDVMARTPADGGTNLEQALALGSELALRHRVTGAQNRVVLLTDGAANLGNADPAALARRVETLRQQGVAFDACGVGLTGIDDDILESLTRQGDGRYYVLNSAEAADAGFARQLAGAFRPAAENVKVQVRFNPARVAHHRLIGFEQHRLATEDFRNDRVDAAELAAEEAAVALYQVEVLPQGTGELGDVFVRFRDAATGQMVERSWTIRFEANAPVFARATPSLRLAGTAALLAEKLRRSPVGEQFKLGDFTGTVDRLRREYPSQSRVQELATMFAQARRLLRE